MTPKPHAHQSHPANQVATDKCAKPIMQLKYIAIFEKMGKQLSINPFFIMSTALQESGWDLVHVFGTTVSAMESR